MKVFGVPHIITRDKAGYFGAIKGTKLPEYYATTRVLATREAQRKARVTNRRQLVAERKTLRESQKRIRALVTALKDTQ
jgi:hypothetical protein